MAKTYIVVCYRKIRNQEALRVLGDGAERDMRIVAGFG